MHFENFDFRIKQIQSAVDAVTDGICNQNALRAKELKDVVLSLIYLRTDLELAVKDKVIDAPKVKMNSKRIKEIVENAWSDDADYCDCGAMRGESFSTKVEEAIRTALKESGVKVLEEVKDEQSKAYYCTTCRKGFISNDAYINHWTGKKHKNLLKRKDTTYD